MSNTTQETTPTLNARIIELVTPIVAVCVPDLYNGDLDEYCTFNFDELPEAFGDDQPNFKRCLVQVHYFAPLKKNVYSVRKQLFAAICGEELFGAPSVTNASDEECQHYVFEFDALDEV